MEMVQQYKNQNTMIRTTQHVAVETRDKRSTENKVVYAEIQKIEIVKDRYVITINEFVIDTLESTDFDGNPTTIEQKRPIVTIFRKRTKDQLLNFIKVLKDETSMTAFGLTQYFGIYDTLNQIEKNDFVAKMAHIIENNNDSIRNATWEFHTE